jgi:hypothetical protein
VSFSWLCRICVEYVSYLGQYRAPDRDQRYVLRFSCLSFRLSLRLTIDAYLPVTATSFIP